MKPILAACCILAFVFGYLFGALSRDEAPRTMPAFAPAPVESNSDTSCDSGEACKAWAENGISAAELASDADVVTAMTIASSEWGLCTADGRGLATDDEMAFRCEDVIRSALGIPVDDSGGSVMGEPMAGTGEYTATISCAPNAEEAALWDAATTRQLTRDELLKAMAAGNWLNIRPCESYSATARMNELIEILAVQAQELLKPSGRDIRPMLDARRETAGSSVVSISAGVGTITGCISDECAAEPEKRQ